jgi:ketosteroid isomerase-like protein
MESTQHAMIETEEFLQAVLPRQREESIALHNGDPGPRLALWSRNDPVSLFGALQIKSGWDDVGEVFEWVASRFSNCEAFEFEVIGAGASGDLGYVVGIEHTTASVGGEPARGYELRVTTIFRRENGDWKAVHRHADPVPESVSAGNQLARLGDSP